MSKARDLADFISTGSILSDGTIESTEINGVTADASELNVLDGITVTTEELNNVAGISTSVQTQLDGKQDVVAGVSDTEIGYLDGVTSNLQTQLDNISVTSGSLTKSFTSGETASITLAQAISPAPVVSATKEVPQAGISSKGSWDVNASASNYDLHDTAYDTTLTPSSVVGEIEDSTLTETFNTQSNLDNNINSFFNNDGTRLYVYGYSPRDMFSYSLSTPYDISTRGATRLQQMTFPALGNGSFGPRWNNDGTKIYYPILSGYIYEFAVSTAYDLSTIATSSTSTLNLSAYTTGQAAGIVFKPDGTRLWLINDASPLGIAIECTLSTAWDLSTASYTAQHTLDAPSTAIAFADNGSTMYSLDRNADLIYKFNLSTAYDLSTLDFAGAQDNINLGSGVGDPCNITIDNDDKVLLVANYGNHNTYQYSASVTNSVTLGTGSFASTDVGKRIQGNGGDVTLTSTAGAYDTTGGSAFTDSSTIASGSWSMRGLKSAGDADGLTLVNKVEAPAALNTWSDNNNSLVSFGPFEGSPEHAIFDDDGSAVWIIGSGNDSILRYHLSTPYDLSTGTLGGNSSVIANQMIAPRGFDLNPQGTIMFVTGESNIGGQPADGVWAYSVSTPWDLYGSVSYTGNSINLNFLGGSPAPRGGKFSSDGTKYYFTNYDANAVVQLNFSSAYDITSYQGSNNMYHGAQDNYPTHLDFNSDGTEMYVLGTGTNKIFKWNLSTAWDIASATYSGDSIASSTITGGYNINAFRFYNNNTKLLAVIGSNTTLRSVNTGSITLPTSQYHIGVTNSSGQINTAFWTDLNTMVADQDAGDGTVHYAVSTDDRTTWSVIKEGSGVRPIVRDNSGTWQYNSDAGVTVGGSLANGSYVSEDVSTFQTGSSKSVADSFWGDSGNHLFILDNASDSVMKYSVSTAYDLSTINATPVQTFSVSAQEIYLTSMWFSPDGLHMYIGGNQGNDVNEYTLTSAWDLSTASFTRNTLSAGNVGAISLSSDGTIIHTYRYDSNSVGQATLSTAWNTSTAGSVSYYTLPSATYVGSVFWASNGYTLYVGDPSQDVIHKYTVSTAYDLSSTLTRTETLDVSAKTTNPSGMVFNSDLSKLYIMNGVSAFTYNTTQSSYGTSTTWVNSTTNDEFYALQQALGYNAFNRMDKTQLDAVTDPNHYTLGDTLDLAIALRTDTASISIPTSDGVSINYDAEALNQGAVLGTDYDYDFPDSTTVRVTSNATQNLKIRVV